MWKHTSQEHVREESEDARSKEVQGVTDAVNNGFASGKDTAASSNQVAESGRLRPSAAAS